MIRRFRKPVGEWREVCVDNSIVRFFVTGVGPPLLLIHGLSGSVRWWRHNMSAFAQYRRVYALDLLEYEPKAARLQFAFPEAARRIALWLDLLGLDRVSIVGHSMGGAIAAELAADAPERVDKLVLVDAAALFPQSRLPLSLPTLVRKTPHFSPTLVPVLLQDAWRTGPRLLWNATRDLFTVNLRPKLEQIQAETLVIWGKHDGILPVSLADELCRLVPRSRAIILPRAGHNPMWEQPKEFNTAVLKFLGSSH